MYMIKLKMCWLILVLFLVKISVAQHQYYKLLTPAIVLQFTDTTKKINFKTPDTTANYSSLLNYVLRFYPSILFKSVKVYTQPSQTVTKLKPTFFSIFKAPQQRTYKLYFSTLTHTTLDSVLLKQLSYNSKVGLVAGQISHLHDLTTTHFFGFIGWYFKKLSHRAVNKMEYDAELKTLEVGLGYQLLSLANENNQKLKIDKWLNPKGYSNYVKQTQGKFMAPETIVNFINDMPVYVSQQYK